MKSFTKVAALAAILSTVVVPCVSAMEMETESNDLGFYALVAGAGLAGTVVLYKVGSWAFGGSKKATETKTVVTGDASKVEAALEKNEKQVTKFINCKNFKKLSEVYGVTKADVTAYLNK